MKVIYYSRAFFTDCDFPLVKALQDKGVDVHYYIPLQRNFHRSVLFNFNKPLMKMQLIRASEMEEMQIYKDAIDLSRLYFIAGYPFNKKWLPSWYFWAYALWHMSRKKPDIFHFDWPFSFHFEKIFNFFPLGCKKIMTVHDPISHSGKDDEKMEQDRRAAFRWANAYILLNKVQGKDFMASYNIPESRISYSHLGAYDTIAHVEPKPSGISGPYILFFGFIESYKGLEYLLEAMLKVHEQCPDLKLVVAGSGELYFEAEQYQNLDYIVWRHRYIDVPELAGLLKDCEFTVCPYKDATQSGVVQTAFSMNVPIIATNVGALPDAVSDGVTGMIVPPCNVLSLANSIVHLYQNPEILKEMRRNILQKWLPSMSWDTIADTYIDIYKKVIETR